MDTHKLTVIRGGGGDGEERGGAEKEEAKVIPLLEGWIRILERDASRMRRRRAAEAIVARGRAFECLGRREK